MRVNRNDRNRAARILLSMGMLAASAHAALTWPGCADLTDADFKVTTLVSHSDTIAEPMKMAFDLLAGPGEDAKGKVDVYFTERYGKLRKFDSQTGKVLTLGTFKLTIDGSSSEGLMGIALDPSFKTNHWVYLYYTFKSTTESSWRISRFTLDAANEHMDMASEKVVLSIPIKIGTQHPGGAIQFDAYGDLWIGTGNGMLVGADAYPIWSSPNTNDLRGKILRIHPKPDGTYSIPDSNLFPVGKYPAGKTRPEIYVMGSRNPYTITLDPVRRWLTWGDVGPDEIDMDGNPINGSKAATDKTEEYDLTTVPGNFGYPFFAGAKTLKAGMNAARPVIPAGSNWNGVTPGLDTLPPAIAPIYPYPRACAITGPIYRYDGDLNSSIKMPPHFHRKWLVTDFNGANNVYAFTLSDDGKTITAKDPVFTKIPFNAPLDFQAGPDGAFYVNGYAGYRSTLNSTSIFRIEYTGTCRPALPKLETPLAIAHASPGAGRSGPEIAILPGRELSLAVDGAGAFTLRLYDLSGRPLAVRKGMGSMHVTLEEAHGPGVYLLTATGPEGSRTLKLVRD